MKLKKGDRVKVLSGKDRGKEGAIMRVIPEKNKVIVEGVNVVKKHQKATQAARQGGVIQRDMPIHVSNVALIDSDGNATRVGYEFDDTGAKHRVAKRGGGRI